MPPRFLYRLFPLASRVSAWSERRLTGSGRLLAGLLLAGLLFGLDVRQTLAHLVAVTSFALLAASLLTNLRWRPALAVRRVLPEVVTAGMPFAYFLEITNQGRRIERDLRIGDRLLEPTIDYTSFQRRRLRQPDRDNRFDRLVGFTRWIALREHDRGAALGLLEVPAIAPGDTVRVEVRTPALRRGWLRFAGVDLLRPDPLGLSLARRTFVLPASLLALPRRYALPALRFAAQRHYQRGGISLAHAVGDSQEFASLRDYRSGDPRRHIHWRSLARTGRLIVKEYRDEYFDRHALVVDTHLDPGDEERFEAIISIAASIVGGERPRDAILDLVFAGNEVIELSAGRGLGDTLHVVRWLAEAQPTTQGSFVELASLLRERAQQIASVIVILGSRDSARTALLDDLGLRALPSVSLTVTTNDAVPPAAQQFGRHRAFEVRCAHLAVDLQQIAFDT
jgi:uncharacterized protein (DUF58 family)